MKDDGICKECRNRTKNNIVIPLLKTAFWVPAVRNPKKSVFETTDGVYVYGTLIYSIWGYRPNNVVIYTTRCIFYLIRVLRYTWYNIGNGVLCLVYCHVPPLITLLRNVFFCRNIIYSVEKCRNTNLG